MMREGLIHLLQSLPPKEQLLSQFPNFEVWWDNSHRWWFCLDFHLNIYYPALVTFVFSIASRAPWRQTLFTRGTIWESWWLEWTVLQILIMAQPFNPSEKMKSSDPSCRHWCLWWYLLWRDLHGKSHFNRNIHVGALFMKFFLLQSAITMTK